MRFLRLCRGLVVAVLVAAACGVESQDDAVTMDPETVPFDLTGPSSDTRPEGPALALLYLIGTERLVEVVRRVDAATPRASLSALLSGPTGVERARGLTSAIPIPSSARLDRVADRVAVVELGPPFDVGGLPNQGAALAQVVFTLTADPDIDAVAFTIDGKRVAVPRGDGSLDETPLDRRAYPDLGAGVPGSL
jgi:spore germination protein GerM